jgi:DNA polymerase-3 subunit gamma/tau
VTRLKVLKEAALADNSRTEAEKARGMDHAGRLAMAHLTRAWNMLLKGIRETELHANPLMAAEMLLIRMAHAADFPDGGELARIAKGEGQKVVPMAPAPPSQRLAGEPVGNTVMAAKPSVAEVENRAAPRAFSSFADILALAAEKRDIRLKADLERLVRPIRVSAGQFEMALEPQAPPGIANEIARKLEAWTSMRWMVSVAREGGEAPVAQRQKENRASLFRMARTHPDIEAALRKFPGAEIADVREPDAVNSQPLSESDEESR